VNAFDQVRLNLDVANSVGSAGSTRKFCTDQNFNGLASGFCSNAGVIGEF
jgi:hypothetical protein